MRCLLAVAALLAACRGRCGRDDVDRQAAPAPAVSAAPASVVPKLPPSPDPLLEIQGIDVQISRSRDDPHDVAHFLAVLLERTAIRGDLEDYQEALARSAKWVADELLMAPRRR